MTQEHFFGSLAPGFFDDRDAAAQYIKKNHPEDFALVQHMADEAVAQRFAFQLRWDMEQTHTPVVFEGDIDWLRQPGDDPEFIYAFNRMKYWMCMGQAYAVTGDETYARAFVKQMVHWVGHVRRDDPACEKAWRTIEAGIRMETWCKAIRYFRGCRSLTEDAVDTFIGSVHDHAEYIMGVWNTYNLMSNWGVLANHGLFVAGCTLPPTARTAEYREEALRRLNEELHIQIYEDGVQWEQSPMYHNEVLRCYLDVVTLAKQQGPALPEGFAGAVHKMALADMAWEKPDGREPMMGDSDDIDLRDILTLAAALFADPALKAAGYPSLDYDSVWQLGAGAAEEYERLPATAPARTDFFLQDSGNAVFRSGWEPEDTWVRFHCGMLGAGHGHADQLHFDVSAFGEDVLSDSGRFTYVYGPRRREFKDPSAHNTVTVDGQDFYVTTDSWECSRLSRAVNQKFNTHGPFAYAEGANLGYYREGVFLNRRLIFLKPDVLVVADEFYAGAPHTYRQFFHWGEKGKAVWEKGRCRWQGEKAGARLVPVSAAPVEGAVRKGRISRHYNQAEENDVLEATIRGQGFTSVFTVIALDKRGEEDPLEIEKLPVQSNFKGIRFADWQIEALRIRKGGRSWVLAVAHEEYASPTDTFSAGGHTGFGGVVVFDETAGEKDIGTVLAR